MKNIDSDDQLQKDEDFIELYNEGLCIETALFHPKIVKILYEKDQSLTLDYYDENLAVKNFVERFEAKVGKRKYYSFYFQKGKVNASFPIGYFDQIKEPRDQVLTFEAVSLNFEEQNMHNVKLSISQFNAIIKFFFFKSHEPYEFNINKNNVKQIFKFLSDITNIPSENQFLIFDGTQSLLIDEKNIFQTTNFTNYQENSNVKMSVYIKGKHREQINQIIRNLITEFKITEEEMMKFVLIERKDGEKVAVPFEEVKNLSAREIMKFSNKQSRNHCLMEISYQNTLIYPDFKILQKVDSSNMFSDDFIIFHFDLKDMDKLMMNQYLSEKNKFVAQKYLRGVPEQLTKQNQKEHYKKVMRKMNKIERKIKRENKHFMSITLYTMNYFYKKLNDYWKRVDISLNVKKHDPRDKELQVFSYNLIDALENKELLVANNTLVYKGTTKPILELLRKNQLFSFTQFTSTSLDKDCPFKFMKKSGYKGTYFIFKSFTGRIIYDYSIYPNEKQVLFPPLTHWFIENITLASQNPQGNYDLIQGCELMAPKDMNQNTILWVDQHENRKREQLKFLSQVEKKKINIIYLTCTSMVIRWLERYYDILNDKGKSVKIITNLWRKQYNADGRKEMNKHAGKQLITLIKSSNKYRKTLILIDHNDHKFAKEELQEVDNAVENVFFLTQMDRLINFLQL